ncbi:hypothetical protein D9M68_495400 [compost metagenome]
MPQAVTVFDLYPETTDGAKAFHRWRCNHHHEGFLDLFVLRRQCLGDGDIGQRGLFALVEGLERYEHQAGAGAVDEAVDGQSTETHRIGHPRVLQGHLGHLQDDRFGAIQAGAVRQLGEGDQVLLVLLWDETGGGLFQAQVGQADQAGIQHQHERTRAQQAPGDVDVARARALEKPVEGTEQPASEAPLDPPGKAILRRALRLQQHGGQGRRQGERVECGNHRGDRDGQRELAIELARKAGDEGRRHEHRAQHQGGGDDGVGHLLHGLPGRFHRRLAQVDVALDVLHHHDGVVDHYADGQHQAE